MSSDPRSADDTRPPEDRLSAYLADELDALRAMLDTPTARKDRPDEGDDEPEPDAPAPDRPDDEHNEA